MRTMEDYAKEVLRSAGISEFSEDAKIVQEEIYKVVGGSSEGGKYKSFNPNDLRNYGSQISNNIRRINPRLGAQVSSHLSSVLNK
jgi:hypothetical protein